MHRPIITLAISAICLSACASNHATSRSVSAEVLRPEYSANNASKEFQLQGQGVSVWGDWNTAALLYAQAVKENPTPLNKFNLATAYQRTGRDGLALITYDAVVKEGAGVWVRGLPRANGTAERMRGYDLASESKVRVAALLKKIMSTPTAATSSDAETPMTPQEAAALDAAANPL